jgi:hypothetical protein
MAKIEAVRDGLASDDVGAVKEATDGFPACKEPFTVLPEKGCFQDIAVAFVSCDDDPFWCYLAARHLEGCRDGAVLEETFPLA